MSPMITYLLMFFLVAYALFILIELILNRGWKRFAIQGIVLAGVILILRWTTGFPAMKIAFGGTSPITAVLLMFVCTLVGIAANYFYSLEGEFSWTIFLEDSFARIASGTFPNRKADTW